MASRRFHPTQPEKTTRKAPEFDPCTYIEIVSPAFDSNPLLVRRMFLLSDEKSKYVSVEFYPRILLTSRRVWEGEDSTDGIHGRVCRNNG